MLIAARIFCLIIGYLFGLLQTAYIYGRMNGIDIRDHGSGNAGTTNALRVLGKKAGLIVFLGDMFKTFAACFLVRLLCMLFMPAMTDLFVLYTGFGVILGHSFPFYMNFKGGKGIAATGALVISLCDFRLFIICFSIFFITVLITRYVSLGSILGELSVLAVYIVLAEFFDAFSATPILRYESYGILLIIVAFTIYRHRANIVRLMNGTENKLWGNKKPDEE